MLAGWAPSHARRSAARRSGQQRSGRGSTQGSDRLACEAWNKRMLAFKGRAQPSPTLGDALNADYLYLEV